MKKLFVSIILALVIFGAVISPVYAGGGKNQNEIGAPDAPGPGDDAQGHQAD